MQQLNVWQICAMDMRNTFQIVFNGNLTASALFCMFVGMFFSSSLTLWQGTWNKFANGGER
jgi:hypothetical protein